jgi:hypothetical protein
MMKITLDIDYEIAEPIVVAVLKEQYEILVKDAPLKHEEELNLNEAYKLVLEDFMGCHEFQKYVHNIAKKEKRYDSKKLIEANSGL